MHQTQFSEKIPYVGFTQIQSQIHTQTLVHKKTYILEELVESKGHICMFFLKYHCELNPIERNWYHAKKQANQW